MTRDKTMAPTIEELRDQFQDVLAGAAGLQLVKLSGDASSRQYFRLTTGNRGDYVIQVDASHSSEIVGEKHPYISALKLFKKLTSRVPEYFGHSAEYGWILLGDLGDATLQQKKSVKLYEEAVDLIVSLVVEEQKLDDSFRKNYQGEHFQWAFDETKLTQEMQHTATHLVEFYCESDGKHFLDCVRGTVNFLANRPRFFVHRDYHCRNLMVSNDKLWIIDFQDARMGPITYDIVSLLWDPYVPLEESERQHLLSRWKTNFFEASSANPALKRIHEALTDASFDEEIERMKIQRLLKAAGSYASFLNTKGNESYLPSIHPALEAAHQAIARLQDLGAMRDEDAGLLTLLKSLKRKDSAILKF